PTVAHRIVSLKPACKKGSQAQKNPQAQRACGAAGELQLRHFDYPATKTRPVKERLTGTRRTGSERWSAAGTSPATTGERWQVAQYEPRSFSCLTQGAHPILSPGRSELAPKPLNRGNRPP